MQIQMKDVYDDQGNISALVSHVISGHKQCIHLTNGLTLLKQEIHCKQKVTFTEVVQENVYFSLLSDKKVTVFTDFDTLQIAFLNKQIKGSFTLNAGETRSLLQLQFDPQLLSITLNESTEILIQHLNTLIHKLAIDRQNLVIPITGRLSTLISPLMNASIEKRLSLVGQAYAFTFLVLEQMQMLSHMLSCNDCQSKLFNVQNLLESDFGTAKELTEFAYQAGLNVDALELGFYHIVGETIINYRDKVQLKRAATMLRADHYSRSEIVAKTGFSEAQLETMFIRHFGVSLAHYEQIH